MPRWFCVVFIRVSTEKKNSIINVSLYYIVLQIIAYKILKLIIFFNEKLVIE